MQFVCPSFTFVTKSACGLYVLALSRRIVELNPFILSYEYENDDTCAMWFVCPSFTFGTNDMMNAVHIS